MGSMNVVMRSPGTEGGSPNTPDNAGARPAAHTDAGLDALKMPEKSDGRETFHGEIIEVPKDAVQATLLQAMHLEEQGKLENVFGPSLGDFIQRHKRMQQVAAVRAGDVELIKILEQQDDAFRLENITRRYNSEEMLHELKSIIASGQVLRANDCAWFAAECLMSRQPAPVLEAAIEALELVSQFSYGAAHRLMSADPVVLAASGEGRPDLLERLAVIRVRAAMSDAGKEIKEDSDSREPEYYREPYNYDNITLADSPIGVLLRDIGARFSRGETVGAVARATLAAPLFVARAAAGVAEVSGLWIAALAFPTCPVTFWFGMGVGSVIGAFAGGFALIGLGVLGGYLTQRCCHNVRWLLGDTKKTWEQSLPNGEYRWNL